MHELRAGIDFAPRIVRAKSSGNPMLSWTLRIIAPRFQGLCEPRNASMEWAVKNRPAFIGAMTQAIGAEMQKHNQEQAAKGSKKAS